jgi:uncharacterized SAM-binding protein YcdF (DUF218 family)
MKRFLIVIVTVVGAMALFVVVSFFSIGYYLSHQSPLAKSDAIVAISGGDTAARTAAAVQLYKDGWAKDIIFSGAAQDPNSPSNARIMANNAEADGVPHGAIQLDETSTDTEQNAANVTKIVVAEGYHQIILVTSPYHQRRASIVFHRALGPDVSVLNHSSIDPAWRRSHWWVTAYSTQLTLAELQKTLYELIHPSSS